MRKRKPTKAGPFPPQPIVYAAHMAFHVNVIAFRERDAKRRLERFAAALCQLVAASSEHTMALGENVWIRIVKGEPLPLAAP